jgi:hypothetical protein
VLRGEFGVVEEGADQIVPDQNHGNTAGYTDEDQAFSEVLFVWEEGPGETELEMRSVKIL